MKPRIAYNRFWHLVTLAVLVIVLCQPHPVHGRSLHAEPVAGAGSARALDVSTPGEGTQDVTISISLKNQADEPSQRSGILGFLEELFGGRGSDAPAESPSGTSRLFAQQPKWRGTALIDKAECAQTGCTQKRVVHRVTRGAQGRFASNCGCFGCRVVQQALSASVSQGCMSATRATYARTSSERMHDACAWRRKARERHVNKSSATSSQMKQITQRHQTWGNPEHQCEHPQAYAGNTAGVCMTHGRGVPPARA
jgi:hypothetical protein